ncbi:hypothetical protein C5167_011386 [Papaver somniferum]|uniref:Protein UXT n=1 Tax=Papaver somniferum TaxID=3469 RepID=A0A4Y7K5R7_PAPSO|nr:hypothetical protein C5167_011386 [Papaver somniferum]
MQCEKLYFSYYCRNRPNHARSVMDSVRQLKVQRYEDFVDRRLKPDLVRAIAERDKVFESQKIPYSSSDLRKSIQTLEKNAATSLRTLVNLGSEVYMQADVPDTRHIFVDVGLGFHVQFTWSEALEFISVKEARLAKFVKVFRSCSNLQHHDPTDVLKVEDFIRREHWCRRVH